MKKASEHKVPLYHKVYDYLLEKIKNEYIAGDFLPTQSEIAIQTETSLITVKRAIKELEAIGYLESKAGKGTIVRKPSVVDSHVGVSSWTDSISGLGSVPSTGWIKVKKRVPTSSTADKLKLKARERTVRIKRLRLIDDNPICLMNNEIPLSLVPGIHAKVIDKESLYNYLKDEYGLIAIRAEEEVRAREATEYEIEILQLKTPIVLVVRRLSFLSDDVPFELSSIIAPAESYIYKSQQINRTLDPKDLNKLLTKVS
ncbi:GntR family transcriptional regulator [Flavivirga amylovorans]|uniref:GntR family transcriptional regulator n=1 Tax=Flavivirga amylovorans TaxID=870486 RepID=A0ABT8WXZ9_9FLAO|nr:GntR family transcriptional regulator [Flavivirga amylovorans]MDO5986554.1 GntR family transcriptional regulator [Flavivirga amylovorans]